MGLRGAAAADMLKEWKRSVSPASTFLGVCDDRAGMLWVDPDSIREA
jgi:hypothetical protein